MMSHFHQHTQQSEQTPETSGHVIHWALPYDKLTGRILRPSEASIRVLSQVKPGDKVLDVGCGSGRLTIAAQNWVGPTGEAQGIDPAPEMIEIAQRNSARAGVAAKFEVGLVEALPFPDGTFDLVMNRLMMHHLPDSLKPRGLAEIRRVLKPGGLCLIVDFEPPKSPILRHLVEKLLSPVMAQIDVRNYIPLLVKAGFGEVETGPTNSKFLSFVRGRSQGI
jgi:ubiquinone/menaquinone biosynthesis C-methylase UbiE